MLLVCFSVVLAQARAGKDYVNPITIAEANGQYKKVRYSIQDLGTLGGDTSIATSININGDVVGYAQNSAGTYHAFRWSHGHLVDLGVGDAVSSNAACINANGDIVGTLTYGNSLARTCGAVLRSGNWHKLFPIHGDESSEAVCSNKMGDVVGLSGSGDNAAAVKWTNGASTAHHVIPGNQYSNALCVNDKGDIVGVKALLTPNVHAVLVHSGSVKDLRTLGGEKSYARCVANNGDVVGESDTPNGHLAFIWTKDVMRAIGAVHGDRSCANWINSAGLVVGESYTGPSAVNKRAFMWHAGFIADLNDLIQAGSGWTLEEAYCANDRGLIVGVGAHNGEEHAFLLTPRP
jgi:probable HAF family extracellular repeat protein